MTVLLVGADRLGNIPDELKRHGCEKIIHWDGRKKQTKDIPGQVDLVFVFHDFVNHRLMENVKSQAKRRCLPIHYTRRGIAEIRVALKST